ncbi:MAG: ImmA/IrrE family metallo-endopeptidase [Burkholderiaceae bacterium]|nr:ImmA/IrrE family metallo-endopeptidase [Burkholderiaceae bacterium]
MTKVEVSADLLRWARERARLPIDALENKFPHLTEWESGAKKPTLKQLEAYAKATRAPFGYFFLPTPPEEALPIPDFRTMAGRPVQRPSPDLIEMVLACQERQDWFREYALATGGAELPFVGRAKLASPIIETADAIRRTLGFDLDDRRRCPTWAEALRTFITQTDSIGVLVMNSGIVMNNTRRKLDPDEFRGFALVDSRAPLVFVNGADSKSAQMFTLAHELAHIWLGQSAISDSTVATRQQNEVETWCNRVAAEVLVPLERVRAEARRSEALELTVARMARIFKVSSLVILQRLREVGHLDWAAFDDAYGKELQRLGNLPKRAGGDFYLTAAARYSRRFARALIESTVEGRTLYRDAFRMLGISKTETFNELGRSLAFGA